MFTFGRKGVQSETMSGSEVLTANHPQVIRRDPGGSDRTIKETQQGKGFARLYEHTGSDNKITITDKDAATVAVLGERDVALVIGTGAGLQVEWLHKEQMNAARRVFEVEFVGPPTGALPARLKATKTGTSGNNTTVLSATGLVLTHSADSEAQTMRVDSGDALWVNADKNPIMDIWFTLTTAGATLTADQRLFVGLATAYNATLGSMTNFIGATISGASLVVNVDYDDGTNDNTDDSNEVYVKAEEIHIRLDLSTLTAVGLYINGTEQTLETIDISNLSANTLLQPMLVIQRDAGAEAEVVSIRKLRIEQEA